MASTTGDYQLAAAAAGFTLGFGLLTVWKAIGQTKANKSPLRSAYIYMVWGEIMSNLIIGILGWLFLNGTLGATYVASKRTRLFSPLTLLGLLCYFSFSFVMFSKCSYCCKSSSIDLQSLRSGKPRRPNSNGALLSLSQ